MLISYYPYQIQNKPVSYLRKNYERLAASYLTEFTKKIISTSWSPIIWSQGLPKESNFLSCDLCVLDFDDGTTTLEKALSIFKDFAHIIGTTKSHQKEKGGLKCDRFRVAIMFDTSIFTVSKYRWNMRQYVRHYKSDAACTDGSRTFLPCKMIISLQDDGDRLPIYDVPKQRPKPLDLERYKNKPVSNFVSSIMRHGSSSGHRNKDCFRAALELWRKNYNESTIKQIVFNAIPTSSEFTEREKDQIVRSAFAYRDKNIE